MLHEIQTFVWFNSNSALGGYEVVLWQIIHRDVELTGMQSEQPLRIMCSSAFGHLHCYHMSSSLVASDSVCVNVNTCAVVVL